MFNKAGPLACHGMTWHILFALLPAVAAAAPCFAQDRATQLFRQNDRNADGKLSREEFPERLRRLFESIDQNADGFVTIEEDRAYRRAERLRAGSGTRRVPRREVMVGWGALSLTVYTCSQGDGV